MASPMPNRWVTPQRVTAGAPGFTVEPFGAQVLS
jgi:hypothetical protein